MLPNPAPRGARPAAARGSAARARARRAPTLVFAGRLGPQKALGVALDALAAVRGRVARGRRRRARAGRPRAAHRRARARGACPVPRQRPARARPAPLPCGGRLPAPLGVGELPAHGRRGARGRDPRHRDRGRRRARGRPGRRERPARPAARLRWRSRRRSRRFCGDPELRARLPRRRRRRSPAYSEEARLRRDRGRARAGRGAREAKLLLVGRSRYSLPLSPSLARKFDALARSSTSACSRAAAADGEDPRFRARAAASGRARSTAPPSTRCCRSASRASCAAFRPDAVLAQGAQETALAVLGRSLARVPTRVIADVHGDPAAPARLYGSRARRGLAPLADALARFGLRRSDGVRTISAYTSRLVRSAGADPTAEFAAFMDLEPFLDGPPVALPARPAALFVGVLERYKAVDVLADAWRIARSARARGDAAARRPRRPRRRAASARRRPPGADELDRVADDARRSPARSTRRPCSCSLRARRASAAVVVEAFCRGRGVVGSRVGGIPDLVEDGENGLLVPPEIRAALADALVRVLVRPRPRRTARRAGRASGRAVARDAGGVRAAGSASSSTAVRRRGPRPSTLAMQAYRVMQVVKNGLYRSTGEVVDLLGAPDDSDADAPRPHVPQGQRPAGRTRSRFPRPCSRSRWISSASSATCPSRSTPCATTTWTGRRFPRGRSSSRSTTATGTTSRTRSRSWRRAAFPRCIFAPIAYLADGRPLPHEEPLVRAGVHNPTLDWDQLAELEAGGVRIEAHGIGHRPLAELQPDEALREITISKLRLEERLGVRWRRTRT